jgi:hypothetical protein
VGPGYARECSAGCSCHASRCSRAAGRSLPLLGPAQRSPRAAARARARLRAWPPRRSRRGGHRLRPPPA